VFILCVFSALSLIVVPSLDLRPIKSWLYFYQVGLPCGFMMDFVATIGPSPFWIQAITKVVIFMALMFRVVDILWQLWENIMIILDEEDDHCGHLVFGC